ncbi:MAG: hypothetical protein IM551_08020 [Chitinophagaceae bacterium]|nr:hypothetical protein [Chitinophagaceae bacterium]
MAKSSELSIPVVPDLIQSPFPMQTQYVPSEAEIDEQLEIFADIIVSFLEKDIDNDDK